MKEDLIINSGETASESNTEAIQKEASLAGCNYWWLGWDDKTEVSDQGDNIITVKNRKLIWAEIADKKFITFQMDVTNHGWNNYRNDVEYRFDQFLVNLKPDTPDYMHIKIEYKIGSYKNEWLLGAIPIYCGAGIGTHCSVSARWERAIPSGNASADYIRSPYRVRKC